MSRRNLCVVVALVSASLVISAFAADQKVRVPRDDPRFSGGLATTAVIDKQAYRQPVEFLNSQQGADFKRGESLFDDLDTLLRAKDNQDLKDRTRRNNRGVRSRIDNGPETTPTGPLFNADNCQACHPLNGRGSFSISGGYVATSSVPFHISETGEDAHGGPRPHRIYGLQIQTQAKLGPTETRNVRTPPKRPDDPTGPKHITGRYSDGTEYKLIDPNWQLGRPQHGPADDMLVSPRFPPPVFGLGLIEAVADDTILAMADEEDHDGDGISGKVNIVYDAIAQRHGPGRFGWKAQNPTLKQQIASSAKLDHGLTTSIFEDDDLTDHQRKLLRFYERIPRELPDSALDQMTLYMQSLAVPVRRSLKDPKVRRGEELFTQLRCAKCHVSKLTTGPHELPFLTAQEIYPYTDLLLHDMGNELADDRPVYKADGNEWRTPPLWGIGLAEAVGGRVNYLHDGRARTLEEAILWHGGEAEKSREEFKDLSKEERQAVIAFLESL